jgi:hypothetical protein
LGTFSAALPVIGSATASLAPPAGGGSVGRACGRATFAPEDEEDFVPPDDAIRALEALSLVRGEYGLPDLRKPCIAYVLDGNLGGANRHDAAFVLALELRALGRTQAQTDELLVGWAEKIGYSHNAATKATRSAYMKGPGGEYKYFSPGRTKKPGSAAAKVLSPTCETVGCPANCPAFKSLHVGPKGEGYQRFVRLGWPEALQRIRRGAAVQTYAGICELERKLGFASGSPIIASTKQHSEHSGHSRRHVPDNLAFLYEIGLLWAYGPGGGSGPNARDRKATTVARFVPIPRPSMLLLSQYRNRGPAVPCIGDLPSLSASPETDPMYRGPGEVDGELVDLAERIAARERPRERCRKAGG